VRDFSEMCFWLRKKVRKDGYRKTARQIGVDHTTVYKICNQSVVDPRLSTLLKIDMAMEAEA
jgi:DNA-binding phage protein